MIVGIIFGILVVAAIVVGVIFMKRKGINPFSKCKRNRDGTNTVGNADDKITSSTDYKS